MSESNVKKVFLSLGLALLLIVSGFQFLDSSPFKDASYTNDIEQGERLDEVDKTYLKLFKEIKESGLKNQSYRFEKSGQITLKKRDPFVRPDVGFVNALPHTRAFEEQDLKLNGILWDDTSPSAVISGEIVKVGSQLGLYEVMQIQHQRVILKSPRNRIVLEMSADGKDEKRDRR